MTLSLRRHNMRSQGEIKTSRCSYYTCNSWLAERPAQPRLVFCAVAHNYAPRYYLHGGPRVNARIVKPACKINPLCSANEAWGSAGLSQIFVVFSGIIALADTAISVRRFTNCQTIIYESMSL